jgi:hypothetical protein
MGGGIIEDNTFSARSRLRFSFMTDSRRDHKPRDPPVYSSFALIEIHHTFI